MIRPAPAVILAPVDSSGPEPRGYALACASTGRVATRFECVADEERSADENAVAALIEHSRTHPGRWAVYFVTARGPVPLADAQDGVGYLHASQDAVAADSMHGSQLDRDEWVRDAAAVRGSLDEPTAWGAPAAEPEPAENFPVGVDRHAAVR